MENLKNKAIKLFNNKNYKESLATLFVLLEKNSKSIDILLLISYNFMQLKNYRDALVYFEKVKKLNNKLPQVFYNIGVCQNLLAQTNEAIKNFNKAISLKNNYIEPYIQLGQLLKKQNLFDEAITVYRKGLVNISKKESININISELYYLKKDYELSISYAKEALKENINNYFANINIANCLMDQGKIKESIAELKKAQSIEPSSPMIYSNLGLCYRILGENKKSEENYKKAIQLNPNLHDAYFNLSHIQLSQNNFKEGWANYEHRWGTQKKFTQKLEFNIPQWNERLGFGRIVIWGEQGIGEQILFSSILPEIKNKFEKITIYISDKLVELFKKNFQDIEIYPITTKINEEQFDYHLPICSLGKTFRKNLSDFPFSNQEKINNNKTISNRILKCAISWKSANQDLEKFKSIQLEDLKEILKIDKIKFFNIQYTNEDNEVEEFKKKFGVTIYKEKNLDTFNNIVQLTNFINTCDFVISVSNTNAHLSAYLGKPTLLLLPKTRGKFWYWENEINGTNLWYPSIIKFKQNIIGEWSHPINNLKKYLSENYV